MRPLVRMAICTDHDYEFFKPWSLRFAQSGSAKRRPADIAPMTFVQTLLSPIEPAVATLLAPSSICSVYSLGFAVLIASAWLAWRRRRRDRPIVVRTLARAFLSRRVSCIAPPSPTSPTASLGLQPWAGSSAGRSSRRRGSATASPPSHKAPRPPAATPCARFRAQRRAHASALSWLELGFFSTIAEHRIPALWELHRAHHSAEVLTPLVYFRRSRSIR